MLARRSAGTVECQVQHHDSERFSVAEGARGARDVAVPRALALRGLVGIRGTDFLGVQQPPSDRSVTRRPSSV